MPQATNQLSSPYELVVTTPSCTIVDVVDADFEMDPEIAEHFCGANFLPTITVGNDKFTIRVKTTSVQAFSIFCKSLHCTGVQIKFRAPTTGYTINGTTYTRTQAATEYGWTISTAYVSSSTKISNGSDKKPAEFELEFKAECVAGVDATVTADLS